jgi:cytochrome c oxidase cbb3-type subunit 1
VLGGLMYLSGALIMVYNLWMTVTRGEQEEPAAVPASGYAGPVPAPAE